MNGAPAAARIVCLYDRAVLVCCPLGLEKAKDLRLAVEIEADQDAIAA
jgi:hypothetical protein